MSKRYTKFLEDATESYNVYNKNNVSIFDAIYSKTIDSVKCFGPAPTRFYDFQTDFLILGLTQSGIQYASSNNRLYVASTIGTTGFCDVVGYSFNPQTLVRTLIGRVRITLPNQAATSHTPVMLKVDDSNTSNIKIALATRAATVLINGGVFVANKVSLANFTMSPSPFQVFMAIASDTTGVYMYQDPAAVGVGHLMGSTIIGVAKTTTNELISLRGANTTTINHDGFDFSVAPTITSYPSTAAVVNGTASVFQMTAHPFQNNDMLVFTASPPTGFTASTGLAVQTVYFVRNRTANTFELSATSGGASILGTSVTTPTFVRAFGTSTNAYLNSRKTSTVTFGISETPLLLDCVKAVTIQDAPYGAVESIFVPTTAGFWCYKLSEVTNGATSLPSVNKINITGTGTDYVSITPVAATYSEALQKIIFTSAAFSFYMKSWANNSISHAFGSQISKWLENTGEESAYFRGFVVSGLDVINGILFCSITTTGQRGILAMLLRADSSFETSKLVSPITFIGPSKASFVSSLEKLYELTDNIAIRIRSAMTSTDTMFDDQVTGWIDIDTVADLGSISLSPYAQIEVTWEMASFLSGNPAQVSDIALAHERLDEMDDRFTGMADGTTSDIPSYVVYRQVRLFSGSTPTLFHRAYDDNFNVVESMDTVTNSAQVTYSINDGLSYSAGVGPNQVGKLIRFERLTPPGVIVKNSLRIS